MATRNRSPLFRKYRDALRSVRVPTVAFPPPQSGPSTSGSGNGPVIELVSTSLLHPNGSYAPLSTEDLGSSRFQSNSFSYNSDDFLVSIIPS